MSWLQGQRPNQDTSTREEFTQFALNQRCPDDADPRYKSLHNELQELLGLLLRHDAMRPNIQQTYMTPAAKKSKVYFMWDFTGRTLGMLWAIDYKNPLSNREQWTDCSGRTMMSTIMIADKSEKLDRMSASPGYDSTVEFGPEIERFAAGMRSGFPA